MTKDKVKKIEITQKTILKPYIGKRPVIGENKASVFNIYVRFR